MSTIATCVHMKHQERDIMSTDDFPVTFVGGPLHGQHKRLARGTVDVKHEGVAYMPSVSSTAYRDALDVIYFVAENKGVPDRVDVMRTALMSARGY